MNADDHIIYNTKTGTHLYGKGGAVAVQFVTLKWKNKPAKNVSAADFFVVK